MSIVLLESIFSLFITSVTSLWWHLLAATNYADILDHKLYISMAFFPLKILYILVTFSPAYTNCFFDTLLPYTVVIMF